MSTALEHEHVGLGDGLGGECVLFAEFEPEHVAGQTKAADVSAAIAELLYAAPRR
jgi:hypothetical protein